MKKIMFAFLAVFLFCIFAFCLLCLLWLDRPSNGLHNDGMIASSKIIDSVEVVPYGVFTQDEKQPGIQYRVCKLSVVFGVIFSETVITPVYLFGWELYEPVGKKVSKIK
jgi:hypothetical protein